ncbi:MAG: hypothetical protein ISS59_09170 [Desulfobacteraceae bacterium]|nr:hypothetical protein [Desulfobacteraceae bacterium]
MMNKKKILIFLSTFPILLILLTVFANTFILNVFSGRVHFPEKHIGQNLTMKDGKKFVVFRRLKISDKTNIANDRAVFIVRFQFRSLKSSINKRLSMIPTPFLIGMKGFREKYWTFDENSGFFQGIYQWESKEFADRYPNSFIFKLMTKRSVPGTLSYEIMSNTDLSEYIETLSSGSQM